MTELPCIKLWKARYFFEARFDGRHVVARTEESVNFRTYPFISPFTLGSIIELRSVDNRYGSIIGRLRYFVKIIPTIILRYRLLRLTFNTINLKQYQNVFLNLQALLN